MGGPGSGWGSEEQSRSGRKKKSALSVVGSGDPIKPDLPPAVAVFWDKLADLVAGVAFSQDSEAMTEAAWLMWRQQEFREALRVNPLDDELNRLSLAVGRSLSAMFTQFGLTPRSRQVLLVARDDEEKDEFERFLDDE